MENVKGRYTLTKWVWKGDEAIDLNGDGIASCDLLREAKALINSEYRLDKDAYLSGYYDTDIHGSIDVPLPVQINGFGDTFPKNKLELNNDHGYGRFYMSRNGEISLGEFTITHMDDRLAIVTNYSNMSICWFDGKLTINADATFYDFVTESKVKGPVVLTYTKYAQE